MNNANDIAIVLVRELEGFEREVSLFPDDESVWQTLPGLTNTAGNLALHVAGNLQHYIGTVLGNTAYKRDRNLEFSRRSGTRAEVVSELRQAATVVRHVLTSIHEDKLAAEFPEMIMGMKFRTGLFLVHLCAHAGFHLGQAGYLRRTLTGNAASSGPLPLGPLAL
jgi:hypothetical protein